MRRRENPLKVCGSSTSPRNRYHPFPTKLVARSRWRGRSPVEGRQLQPRYWPAGQSPPCIPGCSGGGLERRQEAGCHTRYCTPGGPCLSQLRQRHRYRRAVGQKSVCRRGEPRSLGVLQPRKVLSPGAIPNTLTTEHYNLINVRDTLAFTIRNGPRNCRIDTFSYPPRILGDFLLGARGTGWYAFTFGTAATHGGGAKRGGQDQLSRSMVVDVLRGVPERSDVVPAWSGKRRQDSEPALPYISRARFLRQEHGKPVHEARGELTFDIQISARAEHRRSADGRHRSPVVVQIPRV